MNYSSKKSEIKSLITRQNVERVLLEVVQIGRLKLVKWILKRWQVKNLDDCLIQAAKSGHLTIVKVLHANGANILARYNEAIKWASGNGYLQVVQFLHANGADIQVQRNKAIRWASRNGHLSVVQFLHANGADIQAKNNDAIRRASKNGHLPVVQFLHANGADIFAIRNPHETVIAYITTKKWLQKNVSYLKRKAASVFVANHEIMPEADTVPTDIMDILEATKA